MKIYFILFLFQVLSQGLLIFAYDDTSQDFLETLDASCIASRVPAPDINNGYVIKYDRKSFKDISYVIALYACDDNFEFEGNTSNVVYCSKDNWIGNLPKCKGTEDYNDYEEDDEDDEPSKNENYDSSESENNLVYQNEKNDLYENSEQERQTVIQSEGDDISNVINIEVAEEASVFEKKPIECPSNHECEHNCISAFYSEENSVKYNCSCNIGYTLNYDAKTCIDIDECREMVLNNDCIKCENTPGSYKCINEIEEIYDPCFNNTCRNAECRPIDTSEYECICYNDFVPEDSKSCRLRDCREDKCQDYQECVEVNNGKFECELVDFCKINNGGCSHFCESDRLDQNSIHCLCPESFVLSEDFKTCVCPLNTVNEDGYCKNIPSCEQNNGNCEQICEILDSKIYCSCVQGFEMKNSTHCQDIDECQIPNICDQKCYNTIGSYECKCSDGYILNENNNICEKVQRSCEIPSPPQNGYFDCKNNINAVECSITCNEGYILQGSNTTSCNDGDWYDYNTKCVPIPTCSSFRKIDLGEILPSQCTSQNMLAGEICNLNCLPGYISVQGNSALCNVDGTWTVNELNCIKQHEIQENKYIKCPRNTTIILGSEESHVHVRLENPKTNSKIVRIYPKWARQLNMQLGLGVHVINFKAFTDDKKQFVMCDTKITVKREEPPKIIFCPQNIETYLLDNELGRSMFWKEPIFLDKTGIKSIYKSKKLGEYLYPGLHKIVYEATSIHGLKSRCEFSINIKTLMKRNRVTKLTANLLENHESFLVCEGSLPIKIDKLLVQDIPTNCYVKNVKINPKLNFLLRKLFNF